MSFFEKQAHESPILLFGKLPAALVAAHAALEAYVQRRAELVQRQAELGVREPAAIRQAEAGAAAFDAALTDLAMATDDNSADMQRRRDTAKTASDQATEALEMLRRGMRGLTAKLAEIDDQLEAAFSEWSAALDAFRVDLREQYRRHLAEAMTEFIRALRVAHTIEYALPSSGLGHVLRGVKVPDPMPRSDRVAYLIADANAWLAEDPAAPSEDLTAFEGDAGIVALYDLLAPFGRTHMAAKTRIDLLRTERASAQMKAGASRPKPKGPPPDRAPMSDAEYRQHQAEQIERDRRGAPFTPNSYTIRS